MLDIPDLDLRCIFDDLPEGDSLTAGTAFFSLVKAIVEWPFECLPNVIEVNLRKVHKCRDEESQAGKDRTPNRNRAAEYYYEGMVAKTDQQCSHV